MKRYAIIDTPKDWPKGVLQRPETARYSLDGSKVVVKWVTDEAPAGLGETTPLYHRKDADRKPQGAGDILAALDTDEWREPAAKELAGPEWGPILDDDAKEPR